jgi:hypothetical protein
LKGYFSTENSLTESAAIGGSHSKNAHLQDRIERFFNKLKNSRRVATRRQARRGLCRLRDGRSHGRRLLGPAIEQYRRDDLEGLFARPADEGLMEDVIVLQFALIAA